MNISGFLSRQSQPGTWTCVVAFGSSNTQRRIPGMNWIDCCELAWKISGGRDSVFINSGRGGDTTELLLERMERDCLRYQPHLVFLTVGGNDANPTRGISNTRYCENLRTIIERIRSAGGLPVLQTYYAPDIANMGPGRADRFQEAMESVRTVSRETECPLIDHLMRWEKLRDKCYAVYQPLMIDPMHINATGNLILGLDVVRAFQLKLPEDPIFGEARAIQALMDSLCGRRTESLSERL